MRRTEDYNLLRDFAIRNYAEIPFIDMGFEPVKEWTDNIPELCFVRGMQCYFELDLFGMNKEIRKIEKHLELRNDKKTRDIYLNLLYARPDFPLEQWLDLLGKARLIKNKKFSFTTYLEVRILICVVCAIFQNFFPVRAKKKIRKCESGKKIWTHRQGNGISSHMNEYYMEISQEKQDRRGRYGADSETA